MRNPKNYGKELTFLGNRYLRRWTKSTFILNVVNTFATKILVIAIGFVLSVIVARILGPEGKGLYSVATMITTIGIQLGILGLHSSNTYYAARERELLPALLGNSFFVAFAIGGVGALSTGIFFKVFPSLAPVHGFLLVMALIWIPFALLDLFVQNLLIGISQIKVFNIRQLVQPLLRAILIGAVIVCGTVTTKSIFFVSFLSLAISLAWALKKLWKHLCAFPACSLTLLKKSISFGFRIYLGAFFSFLVLRIDLLMVKQMLGAEQAGYYSIAAQMVDLVGMLSMVTGKLFFPKLSAMNDVKAKYRLTKKMTLAMSAVMFIFLLLAYPMARPAIVLVFGNSYSPSIPAFIYLLPAAFFLSLFRFPLVFINSEGMPWPAIFIWIGLTALNISLNYFWIPVYGIKGASMSSSLCYLGAFILFMLYANIMTKNRQDVEIC